MNKNITKYSGVVLSSLFFILALTVLYPELRGHHLHDIIGQLKSVSSFKIFVAQRENTFEYTDDSIITAKVKSLLAEDDFLKSFRISQAKEEYHKTCGHFGEREHD